MCTTAYETRGTTRLKSYSLPGELNNQTPTICEAALATSAATRFFDPVTIEARKFVGGELGANNPVDEVEAEASDIWCAETADLKPLVKCFISIGTGNPGKNPIEDTVWKFLSETLVEIATETERTAVRFAARWKGHLDNKRYFRFNVQQGLQHIGLAEYKKEGLIETTTFEYLEETDQYFRVRDCARNLEQKRNKTDTVFAAFVHEYNIRILQLQTSTAAASMVPYQSGGSHLANMTRTMGQGLLGACPPACPCTCHDIRHIKTPFRWLFGMLIMNYSGTPLGISKCSEPSCGGSPSQFCGKGAYYKPRWLRKEALHFLIKPMGAPETSWHLELTLRNLVPWGCPFFIAAYNGDVEQLKALIKAGVGLNDQSDDFGSTALGLTLAFGQLDACEVLIKAGANPNIPNTSQRTTFDDAWEAIIAGRDPPEYLKRLEWMFPRGDKLDDWNLTNIHKIVMGIMHRDLKYELRQSSSSINARDAFGRTALWWSCSKGSTHTTETLLRHGADLNIVDNTHATPLHAAVTSGNIDMVRLMLRYGAESRDIDDWGSTPLMTAVWHDSNELIDLLLKHGADIRARDKCLGQTALSFAAKTNHVRSAKSLLEHGADMNEKDDYGDSPLFLSVLGRAAATTQYFLRQGADYTVTNKSGKTILHYAAEFGTPEVLAALTAFDLSELDIHAKDKEGKTANDVFEKSKTLRTRDVADAFYDLIGMAWYPEVSDIVRVETESEESSVESNYQDCQEN